MRMEAREKFISNEIVMFITLSQGVPRLVDWKSTVLFILREYEPHQ